MRPSAVIAAALCLAPAFAVPAAAPPADESPLRLSGRIDLDGPVRWDYVTIDPATHLLYVAQGTQVAIIDTRTDRRVGVLADTPGVHGVAVAGDLGRVFSSNGADDTVGVFEQGTWRRLGTVKAGRHPDAIVYDPASHRVVVFNGRSQDATVIDARTSEVIKASIPVGGKPEFAVMDDHGHAYFNIEDTSEIAVMDVGAAALGRRYSVAPCADPTGLDRDEKGHLYSVCSNGIMVASDPAVGRVIASAPIGAGPDGVAWFEGRAVSANGREGTVTAVAFGADGRATGSRTTPTAKGARTIAVDRALRKLYLPVADFGAPAAPAQAASARPVAVAGTFHLLVLTPATH